MQARWWENLKAFVTTEMSTMSLGIGNVTSSLPLI